MIYIYTIARTHVGCQSKWKWYKYPEYYVEHTGYYTNYDDSTTDDVYDKQQAVNAQWYLISMQLFRSPVAFQSLSLSPSPSPGWLSTFFQRFLICVWIHAPLLLSLKQLVCCLLYTFRCMMLLYSNFAIGINTQLNIGNILSSTQLWLIIPTN